MLEGIHEEQIRRVTVTNARLWRQRQTAETVVIHHIVAENTMGEAMMTALKRKDRTQDALMRAVKAEMAKAMAA